MISIRTLIVAVSLVGAALLAGFAKPELKLGKDTHPLAEGVPNVVGPWKAVSSPMVQIELSPRSENAQQSAANTYDETLMRTYTDGQGRNIMLALAYGRNQRQEQKIHRPELCYVAQGFELNEIKSSSLSLAAAGLGTINTKRMLVGARDRKEAVSYWIRTGSLYSDNAVESRLQIFKDGLKGTVPDGILVRASQFVPPDATSADIEAIYANQEQFLVQLVAATPADYRQKLAR